jgi:hypothetical protein
MLIVSSDGASTDDGFILVTKQTDGEVIVNMNT